MGPFEAACALRRATEECRRLMLEISKKIEEERRANLAANNAYFRGMG